MPHDNRSTTNRTMPYSAQGKRICQPYAREHEGGELIAQDAVIEQRILPRADVTHGRCQNVKICIQRDTVKFGNSSAEDTRTTTVNLSVPDIFKCRFQNDFIPCKADQYFPSLHRALSPKCRRCQTCAPVHIWTTACTQIPRTPVEIPTQNTQQYTLPPAVPFKGSHTTVSTQ